MNAVIGMSGLLLETQLDDEQRDFADTIRTSGDALLTIINDILDFSKIEAGRVDLAAEPFSLAGADRERARRHRPDRREEGGRARLRDGRRPARGDRRRRRPAPPDRPQPPVQRGQVHRAGRGRPVGRGDTGRARHGTRGRSTSTSATPASASRPTDGSPVPVVQPGRRVDLAALRRDGPGARDQPPPRRVDGRRPDARRAAASPARAARSASRLPVQADDPAGRAARRPSRSLRGCRVLVVDDNATNRRILTTLPRALGRRVGGDRVAARGARLGPRRAVVRCRDPRPPDARARRRSSWPSDLRDAAAGRSRSRSSSSRRSASTAGRRRT